MLDASSSQCIDPLNKFYFPTKKSYASAAVPEATLNDQKTLALSHRSARTSTPDCDISIFNSLTYDGTTCRGIESSKGFSSVTHDPVQSDSTDLDPVAQLQSQCDPGVIRYDHQAKLTPVRLKLWGKLYVAGYIEGIVYKDTAPGSQVLVLTLSTSANTDLVKTFEREVEPIKVGAITLKATLHKDDMARTQRSMQKRLLHARGQPIGTLARWVIWEASNLIERGDVL